MKEFRQNEEKESQNNNEIFNLDARIDISFSKGSNMESFDPDKRLDKVEKRGGAYKDLPNLPGKEKHHMPSDAASKLDRGDGPCIVMDAQDHKKTASWGHSRESMEYQAKQKTLIDEGKFHEALQMDIDDIHDKFGDKYDNQISQVMDYVNKLEQEEMI